MIEMSLPGGLERRREDYKLITGLGHYVDDLKLPAGRPPALHMVVVRSPYAHAEIQSIEVDTARALPGVVAVFTGAELVSGMRTMDSVPIPGLKKPERRPLAGCATLVIRWQLCWPKTPMSPWTPATWLK